MVRRQLRGERFRGPHIQSAFASSFVKGGVGPGVGPSGGQESYSGLFDSNVALTFRLVDELISDAPSVAVRVGGILAGAYDTGYVNSLGDGGHGVETSLIIGKFGNAAGFSAEVGFRIRGSTDVNTQAVGGAMASGETVDVPNDMFVNLGLFIRAGSVVTLGSTTEWSTRCPASTSAARVSRRAGFPGSRRTHTSWRGRLLANLTDTVNLNVFFGQVVAGNNSAASGIFGAGIGIGIGAGGFDF